MTFSGDRNEREPLRAAEDVAETLTRAAATQADWFDESVGDEGGQRLLRASLLSNSRFDHLPPPAEPSFIGDVELCPYASEPMDAQGRIQLNLFADAARSGSVQISLAQLRDWYKLAKALHRPENYLARIAAINELFQQQYGKGQSNTPQPFTGWTADEVEAWLWDLAVQEARQAQQKASAAAPPAQMDLFA